MASAFEHIGRRDDRQKSIQTMVLVALVVGVISHLLLTRRWGAAGAATVQLITISIWNIGAMLRTRQVSGFWPVAWARGFGSLRSMLTTGTP